MSRYSPPVQALFSLGELDWNERSPRLWRDYRTLGLGDEHGPEIARLLGDGAVLDDGDGDWTWTPVHAWRAAGQLRLADAVPQIVDILLRRSDDDWVTEELPVVLGLFGPSALPVLRPALPRAARQAEPWAAVAIALALKRIASEFPGTRSEVVAALSDQLSRHDEQDGDLNGFLVSYLVDLRAVEAVASIQDAFEAGSVSPGIMGDWEDVQVELGLLAERTTPAAPAPWPGDVGRLRWPREVGGGGAEAERARGEARERKKAARRRKEAKKARKRRK